jgi:hypothetical protein
VIQDDAVVSKNFSAAIYKVAARNPYNPVVLFLGGFPQATAGRLLKASIAGQRYMNLGYAPIVPLVGVLWPIEKARHFLEWAESGVKLVGHPTPRADDGIAAQWMKRTKQEIRVTVPSLVQHLDNVPSVKGGQPAAWGRDRQRVAALFAEDASHYEW